MITEKTKINKSKRIMIGIPEGTLVHSVLYEQDNGIHPKWKILEEILRKMPKTREERAAAYFDEFVQKVSELFPEVEGSLNFLRPLIIRQIINKNKGIDGETNPLSDSYYEELKQL